MTLRFIILIVCLNSWVSANAQILIQGQILDSLSGDPLPSATVGISGTTLGTASNKDGRFVLRIPDQLSDSLFFVSYVGYKSFFLKVSQLQEETVIQLEVDEWLLEEVEVRPWEPWDYIIAALNKIPDNYLSEAFLTTNYYNEYISENEQFLKFTEGVISTYNPAYGDTTRIASRLIQARSRDDLSSIAFMRKRLEKKMEKELKKARKSGDSIDFETLDDAVMSASFGGPRQILNNDPIRDTASFLNPKNKKYFKYSFNGYTSYHGMKVIIIHFESTRKFDHQKKIGDVYITLDTDAIVVIEFESRLIIPNVIKPIMFLAGLGVTDPALKMDIHYKPYQNRWYINDISIEGSSKLTHKKMFKKNDHSIFEFYQSLITTNIEMDDVHPIPKDEQLKNWRPLEDQIETDAEFWKSYSVVRTEN